MHSLRPGTAGLLQRGFSTCQEAGPRLLTLLLLLLLRKRDGFRGCADERHVGCCLAHTVVLPLLPLLLLLLRKSWCSSARMERCAELLAMGRRLRCGSPLLPQRGGGRQLVVG